MATMKRTLGAGPPFFAIRVGPAGRGFDDPIGFDDAMGFGDAMGLGGAVGFDDAVGFANAVGFASAVGLGGSGFDGPTFFLTMVSP